MVLRNRVYTVALTLGLIAAAALAPVSAETPSDGELTNNETIVTAEVTSGGTFEVYFCQVEVDANGAWLIVDGSPVVTTPGSTALSVDTAPSAHEAGHAEGTLFICYIDTLSQRPAFNVTVHSSEFTAADASIQTPIGAGNFMIARTWDAGQVQWSSVVPGVGDISSFSQNGYVGANTLPADWTIDSLRSLDSPRAVQYGYNGIGTIGAAARFDVELIIPAGTAPGSYSADVTLTIIAGTQVK